MSIFLSNFTSFNSEHTSTMTKFIQYNLQINSNLNLKELKSSDIPDNKYLSS